MLSVLAKATVLHFLVWQSLSYNEDLYWNKNVHSLLYVIIFITTIQFSVTTGIGHRHAKWLFSLIISDFAYITSLFITKEVL